MRLLTARGITGYPAAMPSDDRDLQALLLRMSAEFQEMPGLLLTVPQAARLFCIETARCERLLRMLVERGILSTDGRAFARAAARVRCA